MTIERFLLPNKTNTTFLSAVVTRMGRTAGSKTNKVASVEL